MNTSLYENAGKLLIAVMEKHTCDAAVSAVRTAGAPGGTVLMGRGTAQNKWLRLLGLDDVEKELLYCLLPASRVRSVMNALRDAPALAKTRGIMFTIDVLEAFRPPVSAPAVLSQSLLSVIVNNGGADQVMDAARNAGATGGTVIHARGTARPDDASFFGITIVPEKEFVMILSPREKSARIMESIKAEFRDAEPGSGIAFRTAVESFETLGLLKNGK